MNRRAVVTGPGAVLAAPHAHIEVDRTACLLTVYEGGDVTGRHI